MIICIDIGNTNIKYAIYRQDELVISFRVATDNKRTSDEYGSQLMSMLRFKEIPHGEITGGIMSSVVPSLDYTISHMCDMYLGFKPLQLAPGLRSGLNIRCDNVREVGADRIVNCVSALVSHGEEGVPMIVIDFGTATTFNIINAEGVFVGGVIAPGIKGSLDSLVNGTAKLPRVEIEAPRSIIAKNTVTNMICRRASCSALRDWWNTSSGEVRRNCTPSASSRWRRAGSATSSRGKFPASTPWTSS